MNLLLLEDADFVDGDQVHLSGRRLKHLHDVHRAETGDRLRVGHLGRLMGEGRLIALDAEHAELHVSLDQPPPAKLPLTLILALPRPKMLKRRRVGVAQDCTNLVQRTKGRSYQTVSFASAWRQQQVSFDVHPAQRCAPPAADGWRTRP